MHRSMFYKNFKKTHLTYITYGYLYYFKVIYYPKVIYCTQVLYYI